MLFGLLAIGLPVAIHLFSRPRLRQIRWAATRFLMQSVQKNRRRLQTEDILLLLLRCLLVALLVLIFARPAFWNGGTGPWTGGGISTAVILLDDSESMGQSDGTQTRFDQARTMIDGILSKLAPGSASALFLFSDRVKPVVPKPTRDFPVLRGALEQAAPTAHGTDLYPALKQAVELLKTTTGGQREIFVLTDSQMTAWRELAKIRQLQDENRKDVTMHFILLGEKGEDNLAVSDLQVIGAVAVVNMPVRCAIRVSNWSRSPAQNIPVKLMVDGEAPQDQGIIDRIEPGASKSVNLYVRFPDPGYHSITASIPGDRLPADNQRSLALLVLEQVRALIVEGSANPDPAARDGFFLRQALVPVRPDQGDQYFLKADVERADRLDGPSLSQFDLVFLSNLGRFGGTAARNLQKYVRDGGSLVVFPGPATDPEFYNSDPNFSVLLPARLEPARNPPAQNKFLAWQSRDYAHPVTALWNDPESGTLGSVRVSKYYPLTLKAGDTPASQVVVNYADGEPAVVEYKVGKGRVFLFSSTATTEWGNLPIAPAFVPLLMRITAYALNGPGGTLNLAPGQPFTFEVGLEYVGSEWSVVCPGEKKRRIGGSVEAYGLSAGLRYTDTDQGGPYAIFIGNETKPRVVFAVQPDPAESNLAQEPAAHLAPLLAVSDAATQSAAGAGNKPGTGNSRAPGREIWYPLVLMALLLALIETALAHRFSQSK